MKLPKVLLPLVAACLIPANEAFADATDGKLSEVAKSQYSVNLQYADILKKNVADQSFNMKISFFAEPSGFVAGKPIAAPYDLLVSKALNAQVMLKGLLPALPVFVNEKKAFAYKRLSEAKDGSKFYLYCTLSVSRTPPHVDKKTKQQVPSVLITCLIVDDVLTEQEEEAENAFRTKFGKPASVPPPAPVVPAAPATPAAPAAPVAPATTTPAVPAAPAAKPAAPATPTAPVAPATTTPAAPAAPVVPAPAAPAAPTAPVVPAATTPAATAPTTPATATK